eukprot:COSAG01_NODE_25779_length_733_cov_1.151420_2_plen_145_part_00
MSSRILGAEREQPAPESGGAPAGEDGRGHHRNGALGSCGCLRVQHDAEGEWHHLLHVLLAPVARLCVCQCHGAASAVRARVCQWCLYQHAFFVLAPSRTLPERALQARSFALARVAAVSLAPAVLDCLLPWLHHWVGETSVAEL